MPQFCCHISSHKTFHVVFMASELLHVEPFRKLLFVAFKSLTQISISQGHALWVTDLDSVSLEIEERLYTLDPPKPWNVGFFLHQAVNNNNKKRKKFHILAIPNILTPLSLFFIFWVVARWTQSCQHGKRWTKRQLESNFHLHC